jgi:tetratricopeptide (TPR) repeat protein
MKQMKKLLPLFVIFALTSTSMLKAQNDQNFMTAEQAYNMGKYELAVTDYGKYIKTFEDNIPEYLGKLHSYDTSSVFAKAGQYAGFSVHHDWAMAYYKRGITENRTNQYVQAQKDFDMAIQVDPKFAEPYFQRGLAMRESNKTASCQYINKALMLGDTSKLAKQIYNSGFCWMTGVDYAVKGKTEVQQKQYSEALKNFDIAISYCYDSASYYAYRGIAYEGLGKNDSALADYTTAIHVDSNDFMGYYRRALTYEKDQKYQEAFNDLTRVLLLNPRFADGYLHHAADCENLNMSSAALYDYQQVLRLKPTEGIAWYKVGLNKKENGQDACSYFEKAAELGCDDAQGYADDCKKAEARKALR